MEKWIVRVAAFIGLVVILFIRNKLPKSGSLALFIVLAAMEVANEGLVTIIVQPFVGYFSGSKGCETIDTIEYADVDHGSVYIHISEYNEGMYTGEMRNGKPHGKGKMVYDLSEDGYVSGIWVNGVFCRAISYEGEFKDGWRDGNGVVVYEGGIKDIGTFYGKWEKGKVVFSGERHFPNGTVREIELIGDSDTHAMQQNRYSWNSMIY